MPVLRPSGSDFTSFVKAAAQYVPAGAAAKASKSGGVSVPRAGLGAVVRTSRVGALASPTTSAVVINGVTPPVASAPAAPAAPPVFSPMSIGGLTLWLDGADPAATGVAPANNSTVATWYDKSGSGYNASGGVSPTWSSNAVQFDGTTTYLTTSCPAGNNTAAYFFVWKQSSISGSNLCVLGGNALGTAAFFTNNAAPVFGDWNANVLGLAVSISIGATYIGSAGASNGTLSYGLNGDSMTSVSYTLPGTGTFTVGAGYADNRAKLLGSINEVLVYNTALETTPRQKIEGYLAWRWGLQSSLPPGHPYKTAAPTP